MPIYEEKLICPLAVRFTQQRIRTTFQDGHDVEATIKEIVTVAGVDGYDLILEAPFPCIEIIRWSANGRGAGREDHWFTFDNRRLYSLQRVAAEHWPKRVAIAVHVLYADAGAIRKKLDSRTQGLSVSIGHAFATANELQSWEWRDAVQGRTPPGLLDVSMVAEAAVSADDAKTSVTDLLDAPSAPSSVRNIPKASTPQGAVLTNLIGQLLDIETKDLVQSCDDMSDGSCSTTLPYDSEADFADALTSSTAATESPRSSLAAPPGIFFAAEADVASAAKDACAAEALTHEEGSLTGLIGKLLELNNQEHFHVRERTNSSSSVRSESSEPVVTVPESTTPPTSKQTREAAQAEWTAKMMQWQRAQAAQAVQWQAAQAVQIAQLQAMRARQTMLFLAASRAALRQQYYPSQSQ